MEQFFKFIESIILTLKVKNAKAFVLLSAFVVSVQSALVVYMASEDYIPFTIGNFDVFQGLATLLIPFTLVIGSHTPKPPTTEIKNNIVLKVLDSIIDFFKTKNVYIYVGFSILLGGSNVFLINYINNVDFKEITINLFGEIPVFQTLSIMITYISSQLSMHNIDQKTE